MPASGKIATTLDEISVKRLRDVSFQMSAREHKRVSMSEALNRLTEMYLSTPRLAETESDHDQ